MSRAAELGRRARRDAGAGAAARAATAQRTSRRRRHAGAGAAAARELAATRAYLRLATDLSKGVLKPPSWSRTSAAAVRARRRRRCWLPSGRAGRGGACRASSRGDPDYARLVAEKARLEAIGRTDSWGPAVGGGETLHPGETDPRVAELRIRLARLGYLVPTTDTAGADFDRRPAADAVKRFQLDYGLNDDGVVGAMTLVGDQRADRDAAGAGGGQPRADALD